MADYGFKIAQAGYDVGTASDQHLVMTSKLNSYKIQTSLQGTATVSMTAGSDGTITIIHNLGYIPAFDAIYSDEGGTWHSIFRNTDLDSTVKDIYAPTGANQYIGTQNAHFLLHNRSLSTTRIGTLYYFIFVDPIA